MATISFRHVLALVGLYILVHLTRTLLTKNRARLPPGPKPKPIIGNITDLPPPGEQKWQHWLKHKDLYGPISSITVLGQTMIILSDARIAFELMEKRSAVNSSRPKMVFGFEMCGWENVLAAQPYANRFRAYRKNLHGVLGSKTAIERFYPLQEVEVRRFLLRVLEQPNELQQHIRT